MAKSFAALAVVVVVGVRFAAAAVVVVPRLMRRDAFGDGVLACCVVSLLLVAFSTGLVASGAVVFVAVEVLVLGTARVRRAGGRGMYGCWYSELLGRYVVECRFGTGSTSRVVAWNSQP